MNTKGLTGYQVDCLKTWLLAQVEPEDHARLWPLVEASVGRIAANKIRHQNAKAAAEGMDVNERTFGRASVQLEMMSADAYAHVLDWLRASLITDAPWLRNTDDLGRPRKLLKCSRYDDLVREADKAMDKLNAQRARALGPDDEEHVADLEQGFSLVRLLTPAALDLESSRMKHCVGHGAYDGGVEDGSIEIYSLRDRLGRPVVTIEIEQDTDGLDDYGVLAAEPRAYRAIRQIQGKRNAAPCKEHISLMRDYAREAGWSGREYYWPFVVDVDGIEHDIDAIPAGAVLQSLDVSWDAEDRDLALPDGLTVRGNALLGDCLSVIPENLTVEGELAFTARWHTVTLPESLQVGGKIKVYKADGVVAPAHLRDKVVAPKPRSIRPVPGPYVLPRGRIFARFVGDAHYTELGDLDSIELDVGPPGGYDDDPDPAPRP